MVGPNLISADRRFTSKSRRLAAMYSKRECISYPGRDIHFVRNGAGSHRAGKSGFCAGFKHVHRFVGSCNAKVADVKAAVLVESTHRLYIMYRINTGILNRKKLGERSRWIG